MHANVDSRTKNRAARIAVEAGEVCVGVLAVPCVLGRRAQAGGAWRPPAPAGTAGRAERSRPHLLVLL